MVEGADLGFSRGVGADFQKFLKLKSLCFGEIFCAASKNLKNRPKKAFLGTFWKMLAKNSRFFRALSPLKLTYIGAQSVFRKFLGSVTKKKDISKSLRRQGVEILEGKGACPQTPPPINPPLGGCFIIIKLKPNLHHEAKLRILWIVGGFRKQPNSDLSKNPRHCYFNLLCCLDFPGQIVKHCIAQNPSKYRQFSGIRTKFCRIRNSLRNFKTNNIICF